MLIGSKRENEEIQETIGDINGWIEMSKWVDEWTAVTV